MTLEEIFKDKPELLEDPCVKTLVEYVKHSHSMMVKKAKDYQTSYHKIIEKCIYSDAFLIDGLPSRDVIKQILKDDSENLL